MVNGERLMNSIMSGSAGRGFRMAAFALAALTVVGTAAEAKTPGRKHCHGSVCHRVLTLGETTAELGKVRRLVASHYDDCRRDRFNPCGLTSSGEAFQASAPDNAASSIHPDGTILLVRNPATKIAAVIRVNNFGPFKGNRKLDLSRAAAERLGFAKRGVATLDVMVVQAPTTEEARYKRKRRYDRVPGVIGQFDSLETAFTRYADMTLKTRIARLDATHCHVAARQRAPGLKLIAGLRAGPVRPTRA